MLADCPDPKEVSDFHFLQLRTLKLAKENEKVPAKSMNIIAASSKYGLLFIGIEGGFKVLKLEDILTVDEDKENRSIEENYSCTVVRSHTPALLAISISQNLLAHCVESQLGVTVNIYDVLSFADMGAQWQPCAIISPKSSSGLQDFLWNPAVEGLYAYCLSDGSLYVDELTGATIKPIAGLTNANVTSVCWSPKGKQIVAGRGDGSFTQFKPTLQEVKTIPPPQLDENPMSVSSICWISNTSFAVVYVSANTPYLFIVSTQKDIPVSYINFYDVCLGSNVGPDQKYFLHLEPLWGILTCASVDSIEIAVLGEMPNWVQWDLKEDGKALLPGKDGATHAIGMAVMYSAQRNLVISESESYPPMPVIFFMTNNGLLVSFHMINSNAKAPSLIYPPVVLDFKKAENNLPAAEAGRMVLKRSSSSSVQTSPASSLAVASAPSLVNSAVSVQPLLTNTFTVGSRPAISNQSPVSLNSRNQTVSSTPTFGINQNSFSQSNESGKPVQNLSRPWEATPVSRSQEKSQMGTTTLLPASEKRNEILSSRDSSYMTAILAEIQSFTKEMQDLKQLQNTAPHMNSEKDMAFLKVFAMNLHNFQKDIAETMQSLSSDIFTLKNVLLESFVMVEEASSRERRRNDHSYITMLKERSLDPITAKRMQKMNQHYHYLSTQLQEVNDKLDQDWINLQSNKKSLRNNLNISSAEAIYKTIVNNQKIIHNLRKKVDTLSKKTEEKKLQSISKSSHYGGYHKRSTQEDLSKLADEFLQVKISVKEEREPPIAKKLSSESQNFLREFLKDANVVTVRPTAVYSPSQSRLLSNAMTTEVSVLQEKEESSQLATVSASSIKDEISTVPSILQTPKASTKGSLSFESSESDPRVSSYAPIYEPITPPEVIRPPEPKDRTFSTNAIGTTVLKDKNAVLPAFKSGISVTSTPDASVFKQKDTKPAAPVPISFVGVKNSADVPPNVSFHVGSKILSQGSRVPGIQLPPIVFPKVLSFAPDVPKNSESATVKPLPGGNSTSYTFTLKSPQPTTSSDPRKESEVSPQVVSSFDSRMVPATSIINSVSSVPESEINSPVATQSSLFQQSDIHFAPKSTSQSNLPFGQSSIFATPSSKVSQAVPAFSLFTTPEKISSSVAENRDFASVPQPQSSTAFLFQKPSTHVDNSNIPSVKEDEVSVSLATLGLETSNITPDVHDAIIVVDTKSPSNVQVSNIKTTDEPNTEVLNKLSESSVSSNTLAFTSTQNSNVVASNQTSVNSFANFTVSKPSATSVVSNTFAQAPLLSPLSSAPPNVVISSTPLPINTSSLSTNTSTLPITSAISIISQPETVAPKSPTAVSHFFPQATAPSSTPSLFGPNTAVTSVVSQANSDVPATTTESAAPPPAFDFKSTPLFGQTTSETSSLFGTTTPEGSTFGQTAVTQSNAFGQTAVTQNSAFGQPVPSSTFAPTSGGFFSQTPSFGANSPTSTTDPNNPASTFSFGKSTFGQQPSGSFGLAKSLFSQSTPSASFTQPASPQSSLTFGQTSPNNNVFGQGSFFSGLGGKPSEENANKNVFGMNNTIKTGTDNNLFGNSGPTAFGVKSGSFSGGSFSSGGGAVAQSGFGSFQQTTPQKTGGFGSAPAFGGAPAFGSPPAFGTPPTFGSGNALSTVFGQQQQQQPQQSNFSNFAAASSPTFGSLASQGTGFGSASPVSGGFGTPANTFGSSSPFGGSSFGGGQQQQQQQQSPGFGSPSSPPTNSSAFTQWRN